MPPVILALGRQENRYHIQDQPGLHRLGDQDFIHILHAV